MQQQDFKRIFIYKVSIVAALGGLPFGFDTAIISGTIAHLSSYFSLSALSLGWAVGCILIGCAFGAALAGKLADDYGRKKVLMVCAVLFALSGLGAALSANLPAFISFRILGGLGVGAAAMVSPMYIAESVPAGYRGRLVSLYQLAIVVGILLAYGSNYYFESFAHNWRWMFGSQVVPALIFLFMLGLVPESPRWLIQKGHSAEGLAVLDRSTGHENALAQYHQILASCQQPKAASPQINQLFSKTYRQVIVIGVMVAVFQQVTGINSILYYAPVIFRQTGLSSSSAILQTIGIGIINVLATFVAISLVDRLGRKTFLLTGSLLMGISLSGIALCFHHQYFEHYLVLAFMLLYVGAFGATLGAVTWVYLSEIFPGRVRGLGLSVATLSLWLADFFVTYSFPYLNERLGTSGIMALYALCCLSAFVFFFFRLPETKGKTLEEIEHLFI